MKLALTNATLTVTNINSSQISVTFNNDNTLAVSVKDVSLNVGFDYVITTNFYNNAGRGSAGISSLAFTMENSLFALENKLTKEKYGRITYGPGINVNKLVVNSMQINVAFNNTQPLESLIAFLVDNVNQIFQKQIKDFLDETMVPQANTFLNSTLENVNLVATIPNTSISIDYSLLESPRVINNSLEVSFNATLFAGGNASTSSDAAVIPHITGSDKQIEVFLNHYVIDSMLEALYDANYLNFYVASESVNSTSVLKLDTDSIGTFIRPLSQAYPNNSKVDIQCNSTQAPSLSLTTNSSNLDFFANCSFFVRPNDTGKEEAFRVGVEVSSAVMLYLEKGMLKGEINDLNVAQLTLLATKIGPIDNDKLKNFFNFAFSFGLPIINNIVFKGSGIELPSINGLSFKDTDLLIKEGFVQLEMNPLFDNSTNVDTVFARRRRFLYRQ